MAFGFKNYPLILWTLSPLLTGCATGPDRLVVPLESTVAGKPLDEYANIWWQWAYSMSPEDSPVKDQVGTKCAVNQSGDVWFLAGGYGTSLISRTCAIPRGKYVFFPVINMVYAPPYPRGRSCEQVKRGAALNNDALLALDVEIDGEMVTDPKRYRLRSPECFDLAGMVPEELSAREVYPTASDGYWMMLKPLSRGSHTIKFRAIYNREGGSFGSMAQDIEYAVVVE